MCKDIWSADCVDSSPANRHRRWTPPISPKRCPCDVLFAKNSGIFAVAGFMHKTSVKIAWLKPNDMSTSTAISLIVIWWLSKIIFFIASMFSSVVDVLGRSEWASSLTSSWPSLNRLYHNWTCILLIVDSRHLILFFTQNLLQFLWSIFFE